MTAADEFFAAAAKEYEEGHVDTVLWARALAQSGADESLAIAAYLRVRATALRLRRRDRRVERRARRAKSTQDTSKSKVDAEAYSENTSAAATGARLGAAHQKLKYAAMAAVALASVLAVVRLMAPLQESELGPTAERVRRVTFGRAVFVGDGRSRARSQSPGAPAVAQTKTTCVPRSRPWCSNSKDAGNWNVLVFYASEWTRKQPDNATAWNELSIGYANLRQFDDALGAAEKAVGLSPQDARLWRNLGHLNLNLERLPEAGSAFERVLALSAEDADALCGAALVAQRLGQTKDTDAIARRAKAAAGGCPGLSDGESVAVVARQSTARKPASSVRR